MKHNIIFVLKRFQQAYAAAYVTSLFFIKYMHIFASLTFFLLFPSLCYGSVGSGLKSTTLTVDAGKPCQAFICI